VEPPGTGEMTTIQTADTTSCSGRETHRVLRQRADQNASGHGDGGHASGLARTRADASAQSRQPRRERLGLGVVVGRRPLVNIWSRSRRNQAVLDGTPVTLGTAPDLRNCWSETCPSLPLHGRGQRAPHVSG
jgi:hypothetical protein